ncbi:acetoin utilization protein AcuC [Ectothiorhodospiraceae bacterium 2226]|nr:acetoin utilization protein AcuC [Ectothiorhodospiraceae bacterium 2226]
MEQVRVYSGAALGRYGFPGGHPFGPGRLAAFEAAFERAGLRERVRVCAPVQADEAAILRFHTRPYLARVRALSRLGHGFLDQGDTPAWPGMYEAAATVVGTTLAALHAIMAGRCRRAFVPIAGLHHARPDAAAGFCVFNDCGVAIEVLRAEYGIQRAAYVDIDVHHGDGVFYTYEQDADLWIADVHEDGRFLYPGTGAPAERGRGPAAGRKLNIALPPGADDAAFEAAWPAVEALLHEARPEFIIWQCGADGLAGDPLAQLRYTAATHALAARRLGALADRYSQGRLLALGGGGYNLENIGRAWTRVVAEFAGAADTT